MKKTECSFMEYLKMIEQKAKEALLKDKIKESGAMHMYFNYDLTPDTWNLLVNKQIYMKFERLFIEKQLQEKNRREQAIMNEIERIEEEVATIRKKRIELEKMDVKKEFEKHQEQQTRQLQQ